MIAKDSAGAVSRKLAVEGVSVSYQAVHKWLNGGGITDEMLEALARAYRVSPAWLKYGEGRKREPLQEVFEALPDDNRQQVLDFIRYQVTMSTPLAAREQTARYLAMIDKIRTDMDGKKKGRK